MDFMQDKTFLLKLNEYPIKRYIARILILDFETETPVTQFEGKITNGSITYSSSPTRKTGSLSIIFDDQTKNLTSIDNLIAIDKKISISIGIENPFRDDPQYRNYGEYLWFKQGVFIITQFSSQVATNGKSISLNFIDKIGMLNGTCGGTLPATVTFHEAYVQQDNGDILVEYPLIKDIISEAVHHFGSENPANIIIEDVPDVGQKIIKYNGSIPIRFKTAPLGGGQNFQITYEWPEKYDEVYYKGDYLGYLEVPLVYPGELVQKSGSTVTAVLDEIVKTLGNFEYFYDENGVFHFRQKKNFQRTGMTPLNFGPTFMEDRNLQSLYFPRYSSYYHYNEFSNPKLISQIQVQPKIDNIKNDFVVWGSKDSSSNINSMIRYHLAIDERPKDTPNALCHKNILCERDSKTGKVLRYIVETKDGNNNSDKEIYCKKLNEIFEDNEDYWFNWREELYRRALISYGTSQEGSYYDEELLSQWRKLYDPMNEEFKKDWEAQIGTPWSGYNPLVKTAPNTLSYWLDIIDSQGPIGKYSVNRIGRRSKVTENTKINEIFPPSIPARAFIENDGNFEINKEKAAYYSRRGQNYSFVLKNTMGYFSYADSFGTCYEDIQSLLYQHLTYNCSISLQCIPILYFQPNTVVYLNLPEVGIIGNYEINSVNFQFGTSGSAMNLQLNEALTII